jgi:hypothetical protein
MNKLEQLQTKYPKAFKNFYGWECMDGWADIIEPIIKEIHAFNEKHDAILMYPSQVKEKFGTLRFYCNGTTDEVDELITKAEKQSAVTCETCGKIGELIASSWLYTACPKHTREGHKPYSQALERGE